MGRGRSAATGSPATRLLLRRMSGSQSGLVFCNCCRLFLRFVMVNHAPNSFLVPTGWKRFLVWEPIQGHGNLRHFGRNTQMVMLATTALTAPTSLQHFPSQSERRNNKNRISRWVRNVNHPQITLPRLDLPERHPCAIHCWQVLTSMRENGSHLMANHITNPDLREVARRFTIAPPTTVEPNVHSLYHALRSSEAPITKPANVLLKCRAGNSDFKQVMPQCRPGHFAAVCSAGSQSGAMMLPRL